MKKDKNHLIEIQRSKDIQIINEQIDKVMRQTKRWVWWINGQQEETYEETNEQRNNYVKLCKYFILLYFSFPTSNI